MTQKTIISATQDGICRITIDRQDKLNALNRAMMAELWQAFEQARLDPAARVVVLRGAGPKAFIAGADIAELQQLDPEGAAAASGEGQDLTLKIQQLGKPVIAAVNGFALGGGCEMALACTLRIASSNALLGLPEIKLGVLPGYGGTQRLARLIGRGLAMEMALTGDPITAERALELGLVNQVVEPAELDAAVDRLAGRFARSAPAAMRCIMDAINRGPDMSLQAGLELERSYFGEIFGTEDMREGTSAFLEKRKPDFTGN
jgi:enoyl-CoA hydratase